MSSRTKRQYASDGEDNFADAMDGGDLDNFLNGLSTAGYGKNSNNQTKSREKKNVKGFLFRRQINGTIYHPYEEETILPIMEDGAYVRHTHGYYTIPDKNQFFCTNCLGTLPQGVERDEHSKKCGRTTSAGEWCLICNVKCVTANEAKVHFNSNSHYARKTFISSFISNGGKYYITNKSASTIMPSDLNAANFCEYGTIIDFSAIYTKRLSDTEILYEKYKKSPVEQLATLMSQMIEQKKNSKGVQTDMVIRNRLILLFDGLLSEINSGFKHCHTTTDDFINSSNLLGAVKLILLHGVNNAPTEIREGKKKQLEEIFSLRDGDDMFCYICDESHATQQYSNRRYLYGAIRTIKNQIV